MKNITPTSPHGFSTWDLRTQIILFLASVTVVQLIVMMIMLMKFSYTPMINRYVEYNRNTYHRLLINEQSNEAARLANQIEAFFAEIRTQATSVSRTLTLDFLSFPEQNRILLTFLRSFSDIDAIISRDIEDRVRIVTKDSSEYPATLVQIASNDALQAETLSGRITYSEPFIAETGYHLAIAMMIPVFSEQGQALAGLYMQINLTQIQNLTTKANIANPGTTYVLDSRGALVGHIDNTRVLHREDFSGLEVFQTYIQQGQNYGATSYINKEGEEVQGAYHLVAGLNWSVIAEREFTRAYQAINNMVQEGRDTISNLIYSTILGVSIMIIISVAIGSIIAVRILNPLSEIAKDAHMVASGEFTRRFELKGASEIQKLAGTLNYMQDAIHEYTLSLRRQANDMRQLFLGSVESLAAAIDAKDPYTRGHSRRVTRISVLLGKRLALSDEQLRELEISALMHDVGKIGIDDAILKKPSTVTPEERKVLQMHPVLGAAIMKPIPLLTNMIPGMLQHHDRWDGSGYPEGLRGQSISLYGRIIAVADTFDAMNSDRPYQETFSFERARDMIDGWSGTRYDPVIVRAFLDEFAAICEEIVLMKAQP